MGGSDRDIWRAAHDYIERYCEYAPIKVAQRADAFLAKGDIKGQRVWKRVLAAIYDLRNSMPVDGERLN